MSKNKIKIAILGSGLGSMTTAYYLTSTEELRGKYEVTIYQQGWRIGGKGASGRNREKGDRIEEHGLHMFMGFYENAFTLMRSAYAEWKKDPANPFQSWTDAFSPQRFITLEQNVKKNGNTHWVTRNFDFPRLPGEPGDGKGYPEILVLLESLVGWIVKFTEDATYKASIEKYKLKTNKENWLSSWIEKIKIFQPAEDHKGILTILYDMKNLNDSLKDFSEELDDDFIFILEILNLMFATSIGLLVDIIPYGESGFDRINHLDFKDWLKKHGATEDTAWSAPVRALYDLVFAYEKGDSSSVDNAQMAAGITLRIMLLIGLGYKDAPLWRMKAGMGDTVFTPLYEILSKQRGVKFEFFHRVKNLTLTPNKNQVDTIELSKQADLVNNSYNPLYNVKNIPSWPSEPFWDQIQDGEKLKKDGVNFESAWCQTEVSRKTLQRGKDFDYVVLGISIGAFKDICKELISVDASWEEMVSKTKTVQTQAVQVWLKDSLAETGWQYPSTVMTSYIEPIDTWADMTELLNTENWKEVLPKSIHYFCGVMKEPDVIPPYSDKTFPDKEKEIVKENAISWLLSNTAHLWPSIQERNDPNKFDFNHLVDASERSGKDRFDYQYWRSNIDPSERYVMSVPGSLECRKKQNESGFLNLFLAGDWTTTRINAGCAESAIESGMYAAQAICGYPVKIH